LRLDKEHSGLPCTVDERGNFTIITGRDEVTKTLVRTAVDTAVATVEKVEGTATVTVA